jgi:hypothetical protein
VRPGRVSPARPERGLPRPGAAHAGYETRTVGKDLYVVPDSAARLVNSGKVDQALFNVSGLIRQGYDDASTSQIPVIATYQPTARAAHPTARTKASLQAHSCCPARS